MTTARTTRINRGWLAKMVIFLAVLAGFGTWGLVDAMFFYPANGLADASFKLKNYLEAAQRSSLRLTPSAVKVDDPREELRLLSLKNSARNGGSASLTEVERAKLEWLTSLSRVWKLGAPEVRINSVPRVVTSPTGDPVISGVGGTTGARKQDVEIYYQPRSGVAVGIAEDGSRVTDQPDQVLRDLQETWKTAKAPKALAAYDLPAQWLFVIAGYGGALYILGLILRAASRRFAYDPEAHALTIPGGVTISPDEVKEFDKRRWHKFFLTLHLRDGRAYKLDLLRHVPLEEWVLEMERTAFPDRAEAADDTPAPV